jgi:hypothetical protein
MAVVLLFWGEEEMTNEEWVKSLSGIELAEALNCRPCDENKGCPDVSGCLECIHQWLQKERSAE